MLSFAWNFERPNPANLSWRRPRRAIVRAIEQHRRTNLVRLTRRAILPQARLKSTPEGWQSGRMRRSRKPLSVQADRRFKSSPLRCFTLNHAGLPVTSADPHVLVLVRVGTRNHVLADERLTNGIGLENKIRSRLAPMGRSPVSALAEPDLGCSAGWSVGCPRTSRCADGLIRGG